MSFTDRWKTSEGTGAASVFQADAFAALKGGIAAFPNCNREKGCHHL